MIHEWRLFEVSSGREWTVKKAVELLLSLCNEKGKVIIADFSFCDEYENLKDDDPKMIEDRDILAKRIGHSHPPREYIKLREIKEAALEIGAKVELEHIIEKPEPDTHRIYWMCIIKH